MTTPIFCSEVSEAQDEPLGTASHGKYFAFYEKPIAEWPHKLNKDQLPDSVLAWINRQTEHQAFRLHYFCDESSRKLTTQPRIILITATETFIVQQHDSGFSALPSDNSEMYFVCTHGKRDQCCAKRGNQVYQALLAQGRQAFMCTHTGGDRFAANVISFPNGHFFGRLIGELLEGFPFTENHEKRVQHFRGCVWQTPLEQMIERTLYQHGYRDINFSYTEHDNELDVTVTHATGTNKLKMQQFRQDTKPILGGCKDCERKVELTLQL